ncbi:MAG: tetratricopeptide repeat protein [Aliifodinibius sp.]|nr:tetratricopeptide repeat protein [Fodinibius sp.]NIV16490.1 tetratricopeptide repeat protein [Fodinibius sp.]NIY30447.1 tetratricopeptide repeat protein [Fodinibius sp.]
MKLLKSRITIFLLGLFIFGLGQTAEAQDRKEAVQTYNSAREMVQNGEYQKAIDQFKKAIEVGNQLGPQGQDIVERAKGKLPEVYRQIALDEYRAFKQNQTIANLDATIDAFRETKDVAEEYDNSEVSNQANGVINQLLYSKSIIQYKQQNYQDALTTLDEVIANDPNYAKAYYQKGIVLKKIEGTELERSIELFDQAIEVGQKTNDSQIVSRARNAARDELIYRGAKATENKNFSRAKELLNRSLDYDSSSADAHYRLAQAYNKTQDWQQAVEHAKESLGLETGGRTDKAKIYFELGTAYQGLGQKENACGAFNNAAYGNFKSPAEHQMEYELKCESTTG